MPGIVKMVSARRRRALRALGHHGRPLAHPLPAGRQQAADGRRQRRRHRRPGAAHRHLHRQTQHRPRDAASSATSGTSATAPPAASRTRSTPTRRTASIRSPSRSPTLPAPPAATTLEIAVGSAPPVAEILEPGAGAKFRIGDTVNFVGKGTDAEDGELTGDRLQWNATLHHDEHLHYDAFKGEGEQGSFTLGRPRRRHLRGTLPHRDRQPGSPGHGLCGYQAAARSPTPSTLCPQDCPSPMPAAATRRHSRSRPMSTPNASSRRPPTTPGGLRLRRLV